MAVTTTLTDDMDGSPDAVQRLFSIGGTDYSIDLTDDNYRAMLLTMEPWRSLASPARRTRRKTHLPLTKEQRKLIRVWANEQGLPLSDRGRFPDEIVQKYYEAHKSDD